MEGASRRRWSPQHATFVRVSLDAGTTQTHQLLHATNLPEYTRILEEHGAGGRAWRPDRDEAVDGWCASFCVFDVNLHEIGRGAERVKATGANYLEVRPVFPNEWRGGGFGNPSHRRTRREGAVEALADAQGARMTTSGFRVIGMIQPVRSGGRSARSPTRNATSVR